MPESMTAQEGQLHVRWEDPRRCTACRACELACSFHHTGVFQPDRASIRVERIDAGRQVYLQLDASCDRCPSEDNPLCVRFCAPRALTARLLRKHWVALSPRATMTADGSKP